MNERKKERKMPLKRNLGLKFGRSIERLKFSAHSLNVKTI